MDTLSNNVKEKTRAELKHYEPRKLSERMSKAQYNFAVASTGGHLGGRGVVLI